MCVLFAGGIRNPCSTSYINSTLQFLLHFKPFLHLLSNKLQNKNYLVKVLYNLSVKINETQNNISADSIISYFNIDPKITSDVRNFISLLYSNLPPAFRDLIFISDIIRIDRPININDLFSYCQNISDLSSFSMLILKIDINNEHDQLIFLNSNDQININGNQYHLYGFVQRRSNHYHLIMHDSEGWINCNDSSLSDISSSQAFNIFSDQRMPIELIILVKNIEMIEFSRRKPIFPSTRYDVNFNSATSTQEDSQRYLSEGNSISNAFEHQNDFPNNDSITNSIKSDLTKNENEKTLLSLKRNNLLDSFNTTKSKYFPRKSFTDFTSSQVRKSSNIVKKYHKFTNLDSNYFPDEQQIDPTCSLSQIESIDTSDNKIFNDYNLILSKCDDFKDKHILSIDRNISEISNSEDDDVMILSNPEQNKSNKIYLNCEYIDSKTDQVIKQFRIELERSDYIELAAKKIKHQLENEYQSKFVYNIAKRSYNDSEVYAIFRLVSTQSPSKFQISIEIIANRSKKVFCEFKANQKLTDVKNYVELYCSISNQPLYFFISINKRIFKIRDLNKKIKEIWKISNHQIKLIVSLNKEAIPGLFAFKIPIYQTDTCFRPLKNLSFYISIDDPCQKLLIHAMKTTGQQLELIAFDENTKKFITIPPNEMLYNIIDYTHLRLQKAIPEGSTVILYETPFTYVLKDDQTLSNLKYEIKRYIGIPDNISLVYDHEVDKSLNPKEAWDMKLFNYMMIELTPRSLKR